MNRKGKQQKSFICLIIIVMTLLVTIFFGKVTYEKNLLEDQKQEILTIYPEIADELSENIDYYADESM